MAEQKKPKPILAFCYVSKDKTAKVSFLDYDPDDETVSSEFEMMQLAGAFFEQTSVNSKKLDVYETIDNKVLRIDQYPRLHKTLQKWKTFTETEGGSPCPQEICDPMSLFNYVKKMTKLEQIASKQPIEISIRHCIMLSEVDTGISPLMQMRVFWADAKPDAEPSKPALELKSNEMEKVLTEAFGVTSIQLSSKEYGFLTAKASFLKTTHVLQLLDKKVDVYFMS